MPGVGLKHIGRLSNGFVSLAVAPQKVGVVQPQREVARCPFDGDPEAFQEAIGIH
jgi:hypothetical protein